MQGSQSHGGAGQQVQVQLQVLGEYRSGSATAAHYVDCLAASWRLPGSEESSSRWAGLCVRSTTFWVLQSESNRDLDATCPTK